MTDTFGCGTLLTSRTVTVIGTVVVIVTAVHEGTVQCPALPEKNSQPFCSAPNLYDPGRTATSAWPFAPVSTQPPLLVAVSQKTS